jgi:hypothetical protein
VIGDQLWLDCFSPDVREAVLDSRRQIAARERVAQEILRREQAEAATHGRKHTTNGVTACGL